MIDLTLDFLTDSGIFRIYLLSGRDGEIDAGDCGCEVGLVLHAHVLKLHLPFPLPIGRYWTCHSE